MSNVVRIGLGVILIAGIFLASGRRDSPEIGGKESAVDAASRPLRIEPRRWPLLDVTDEDWDRIQRSYIGALRTEKDAENPKWVSSPSICLHTLRVRGIDTRFDEGPFKTGQDLIAALTDSDRARTAFGSALLARTMHGARYRPASVFAESRTSADENHIDQNLAGLAELGIPTSHPLLIGEWQGTVHDVLEDTIANYHLQESECEWSNIALILYRWGRSWTNKYGERFDFDSMTADILRRAPGRGSCAGLHVLFCAALLARAQEHRPALSAATHRELVSFLDRRVRTAIARQKSGGSWDRTWCLEESGPPTFVREHDEDVLITGHLLECFLYLPTGLQPPEGVVRRAGEWILQAVRRASPRRIELGFCPYAHAAVCLRQMRK